MCRRQPIDLSLSVSGIRKRYLQRTSLKQFQILNEVSFRDPDARLITGKFISLGEVFANFVNSKAKAASSSSRKRTKAKSSAVNCGKGEEWNGK